MRLCVCERADLKRKRASECVSESGETDQRKEKLKTQHSRLRKYEVNEHEKGPREVEEVVLRSKRVNSEGEREEREVSESELGSAKYREREVQQKRERERERELLGQGERSLMMSL